jgi:protein ImuA
MSAAALPKNAALAALSLPEVWCADQLAQAPLRTLPTGHAALDAQLPGGGWPLGAMVEVLQSFPAQHVWQLLLPALSQAAREQAGPVVLVDAPCIPFGPGLRAQGLPQERMLCVRAGANGPALWAAEQALRCADVAAVLVWLPLVRGTDLRRLHMAAQQRGRLLFVFRMLRAQHDASPAPLRLSVEGVDMLRVYVRKRRGPPLEIPIDLPAHHARLAALLAVRRKSATSVVNAVDADLPASPPGTRMRPRAIPIQEKNHALDRSVAA